MLRKPSAASSIKGLLVHVTMMAVFLSLLLFVLFYKILPAVTNQGDLVGVPDLKCLSINEASRLLSKNRLDFEVADSAYNGHVPGETVLEQFPRAGAKVKVQEK